MRHSLVLLFLGVVVLGFSSQPVEAQVGGGPYVGEILLVPYNFAPHGWALCQGQLMLISQNTALFSLLGTFYGGDGKTTFALPDLQGRSPIGFGQGPGLQNYAIGQSGGEETLTLTLNQIPTHRHTAFGSTNPVTTANPSNAVWATETRLNIYSSSGGTTMAPSGPAGGNQPHDNMSPYLTLNYVIALQGIYPSRN
jgi:microcystin-dependent protein